MRWKMIKVKTYNIMEKIEPKDILAAILLIGGMVLIGLGINHIVSGMMIMITTYYFRKRIEK